MDDFWMMCAIVNAALMLVLALIGKLQSIEVRELEMDCTRIDALAANKEEMSREIKELEDKLKQYVDYKIKYEALTAELGDMAKKYPLFNPIQRVVDAKQQGVKFEKDELRSLVGFKIKDEEGGV